MSDAALLAALRLIRTENVGPITYRRLVERFGTAEKALAALPDLAARGGKSAPLKAFAKDEAEKEITAVARSGAQMIAWDDPVYPKLLKEIDDAPPILTVFGRTDLLNKSGIGVVGARNASLAGRKMAENMSARVGAAGYIITSGLARGIDTAAHEASISTGTIAVVAGGIDVVYPPENQKLYDRLKVEGAIVAESPFGTEPIARHFPRRNRIISGLSLGVLVVEAADKSGSLITARMALEQNREVFAVPGSPLDPRASGTNKLIKDGAVMATSAEDILQVLKESRMIPLRESPRPFDGAPPVPIEPTDDLRRAIIEALSPVPMPIDDLIRMLKAPPGAVLTVILELELAGKAERTHGNKVQIVL